MQALAQRTSTGVITGDMFVNGITINSSFQRSTGYGEPHPRRVQWLCITKGFAVQQQDLHLETATVRESLRFSAMLRQPNSVTREEKYRYAESVINMLGMAEFAEAIVGNPGEGLNVEQRKLLVCVPCAVQLSGPPLTLSSRSAWSWRRNLICYYSWTNRRADWTPKAHGLYARFSADSPTKVKQYFVPSISRVPSSSSNSTGFFSSGKAVIQYTLETLAKILGLCWTISKGTALALLWPMKTRQSTCLKLLSRKIQIGTITGT